jgi:hypothetical protein
MAKQLVKTQLDLFEQPPPEMRMALAPVQRASALEQIQALLMEATAILEDGREAGDDQDQA